MSRLVTISLCTIGLLLLTASSISASTIIDFESLSDSEIVSSQLSSFGVTFTNAIALSAGVSLNELEFPAHSGVSVISDNGGAMSLFFATPQTSVFGFFTYTQPLTFTAFGPASNVIDLRTSAFSSNLALSGDLGSTPNELMSLSGAGIVRVVVSGNPLGESFTLDDLNFGSSAAVPEPLSAFTILLTLGMIMLAKKRPCSA